jgi:hypothetical protein
MKLEIFDSIGTKLEINDLVKIQHERNGTLTFYTRVQIINGQIYPINKFSFDRIIKVDSIPTDCKYCQPNIENNFPEYWMHPSQELQLIKEKRLDTWRMNVLSFEYNHFMRVSV